MAEQVTDGKSKARVAWFYQHNSSKSKSDCKIWDCDSTLYDSFELRSFTFQLNRALTVVSRLNPSCNSPYRAKAGGCFRSFSARRNADLNYELSSKLLGIKRKSVVSRLLSKLVRAFQMKKTKV